MEVDWTCASNPNDIPSQGCPPDGHLMAAGKDGDLDKNSGKRDEGTGMDMGISGGCCNRQTMEVFSGGRLKEELKRQRK